MDVSATHFCHSYSPGHLFGVWQLLMAAHKLSSMNSIQDLLRCAVPTDAKKSKHAKHVRKKITKASTLDILQGTVHNFMTMTMTMTQSLDLFVQGHVPHASYELIGQCLLTHVSFVKKEVALSKTATAPHRCIVLYMLFCWEGEGMRRWAESIPR